MCVNYGQYQILSCAPQRKVAGQVCRLSPHLFIICINDIIEYDVIEYGLIEYDVIEYDVIEYDVIEYPYFLVIKQLRT